MSRSHRVLLAINLLILAGFGWVFVRRGNQEFVIYIGVTTFFLVLVAMTLDRFKYTTATLVSLTVWSAMHMGGGGVTVGTDAEGHPARLYDVILVPLSSSLPILRYDQLVHLWGFGAATLVMFCLLRPSLTSSPEGRGLSKNPLALGLVIVMAGLGVGAFNEIVEFIVAAITESDGVGGYLNTSLDLVADLIGAVLGLAYVRWRYWKPANPTPA